MCNPFNILAVPAILFSALANSNCVAIDEQAAESGASVKVVKGARVSRPALSLINGDPVKGRHKIHVSTGFHEAEVLLKWPKGPKESLAFPVEVKEDGEYFLEVVAYPPVREFPLSTGASEAFDAMFEIEDPIAASLLIVGAFPLLLATHYGEIVTELPERLPPPVQWVTLRLREGSPGGQVIDWREYHHPERRSEDAEREGHAYAGYGGMAPPAAPRNSRARPDHHIPMGILDRRLEEWRKTRLDFPEARRVSWPGREHEVEAF